MTLALPDWPDLPTPDGATFFANARAIFNIFFGYSRHKPTSLAMLAMAEAGSSLDPNAVGDWIGASGLKLPWMAHYPEAARPGAFGLYQWHPARLNGIKAAIGKDIMADVLAGRGDVGDQCEAAWWELSHGAGYGLNAMVTQSTAFGAATQATALFEKAGALDAAKRRGTMAERWAVWFQNGGKP